MKKYKILAAALYIILAILLGCSGKSDYRLEGRDSVQTKKESPFVKGDLAELSEELPNMNYAEVINDYACKLPANFSVTKFRYFVVFSNLPPEQTYNVIDNDIRYTIYAMQNSYIKSCPEKVTPIILFEDYESYKSFSVNTFGLNESDISPYGYYKISKNAIVIRYVSWKGSISHEVTHAMIQNDFPEIPSWFNEGMAALNEKSIYKDGELIGDFSWRILSIRRALNENTYTPIRELMNTNDEELYSKRSSFYYAQSRYLLMYLQQKDLLKKYYTEFRDNFDTDKTGIIQLEKITGKPLSETDAALLEFEKSFKQ